MNVKRRAALIGATIGLVLGAGIMGALAPIILSEDGPTRAAVAGVSFGCIFLPLGFAACGGACGVGLAALWDELG